MVIYKYKVRRLLSTNFSENFKKLLFKWYNVLKYYKGGAIYYGTISERKTR